jgi:shikimate kinase
MEGKPISERHIVLVGLMGSGKTTVGRLLADRLGRPLIDTDAAVEASAGRTVREIWLSDGEAAYRVLENGIVVDALASTEPAVIAAAGGVVLSAENRRILNESDAVVVWLSADADQLVARALTGGHRPLLDDDPQGTLRAMAVDREALYREVADHVVDSGSQTAGDVADEVLKLLAAHG